MKVSINIRLTRFTIQQFIQILNIEITIVGD